MKVFAILSAVAAIAGVSMAAPAQLEQRQYIACSGLTGSLQCCATDVLGLVNLDCGTRKFQCQTALAICANFLPAPAVPTSADEFSSICSAIGQRARCCALPVLDQGVICGVPAGVQD
ncbi:Trihydrophobin [Paramyrothecium foliicola]|nr:Trihydrophobin [Paramyrothecium foliicola]